MSVYDKAPPSIEAPNEVFYQFSQDIDFDYTDGKYPNGNEEGFKWENKLIPVEHLVNGVTIQPHVWARYRVGEKSSWSLPYRIVGLDGAKGDKGEDGKDGVNGTNGTNGTTTLVTLPGTPGTKGDDGAKGDTGDTGPEGPQGPQGEQGEPFQVNSTGDITTGTSRGGADIANDTNQTASPSDPYFHIVLTDGRDDSASPTINTVGTSTPVADLGGHLIMFNGTIWVSYGPFTGISGPQGPQGPQGNIGPTGAPGADGADGQGIDVVEGCQVDYDAGTITEWNTAPVGSILIITC